MILFVCLVYVCRCAFGSYRVEYSVGNTTVDWKTAGGECKLLGFELASKQNIETWIGFISSISHIIPSNSKLWIDYTVEYTPWLSEEEQNLILEEDRSLCVAYERNRGHAKKKEIWKGYPCWEVHNFICQKMDGSYIVSSDKANWSDAAASCTNNNASLTTDEENDPNLDNLTKNGTTYWTGKFRDVSIIQGQGNISSLGKCLTVVKGTSGWINTEEENCSKNYQPLCQKVITSNYTKEEDEGSTTESLLDHFTVSENKTEYCACEQIQPASTDYTRVHIGIFIPVIIISLVMNIVIYVCIKKRFKHRECDTGLHIISPVEDSSYPGNEQADNLVQKESKTYIMRRGSPVIKPHYWQSIVSSLDQDDMEKDTYQRIDSNLIKNVDAIMPVPETAPQCASSYS